MTPEQLRQQAQMIRTMDPAALRQMNPAMANLTDEQVRASADQLEAMASNPEAIKMAQEQMKHMSPEDMEEMQNLQRSMFRGEDKPDLQNMDPSQIMENMDPAQLKKMVGLLKKNPGMLKTMLRSNPQAAAQAGNLSDENVDRMLSAIDGMSEEQMTKMVGVLGTAQRVLSP
eukprot:CAMPEP_0113315418 /NCGR_PEP_ID=MMETSP0010_2-20120614/11094_1 /TAXON_ID=216773 ORGANISM="Corethron hystrix, Strain 308" /NCGR_SAMPLE_ID=MMETSP0010_2 /ASSEMBLY_ACC=CAM_ASM_000155 /LENGTH=171 /DNA_ID=CAMNT_0000171915 /DNA_START=13 /DNA_END=524 /DNA_ORIENTATION=+ /assembly_acc=CAM_ASM_000155